MAEKHDGYIIGEHQLEGLLKNLSQNGIDTTSLDWIKLGQELHIDQSVLNDAQLYFSILTDLMKILTNSDDIKVSGIGLCLTIWCRSNHVNPTLSSLTDALTNIGLGSIVNQINSSYYIKRALQRKQTVKLKWTTLSISGPQGTGKSCFLHLLHNKPLTPNSEISVSASSANNDAILETSSLMASRESTSEPWSDFDTNSFKRLIVSEITKDAINSDQKIRVPVEAYVDVSATLRPTRTLKTIDDKVRELLEERVAELLQQLPTNTLTIRRLTVSPAQLKEILDKLNSLRSKSDTMLHLSGKLSLYQNIKASLTKLITLEENVHLLSSLLPDAPTRSLPARTTSLPSISLSSTISLPPTTSLLPTTSLPFDSVSEEVTSIQENEMDDNAFEPPPLPPRPRSRVITSHDSSPFLPRPHSFDSETSSPLATPPSLPPRRVTSSVSTDISHLTSTLSSSFLHMRRKPFDVTSDLVDLLKDSSNFSSHSLSNTHFIHVITTKGNPLFRDLLPAFFHYNTANVITHPLNEDLDSYLGNDLTHQEILESTIHSLSFIQPPSHKANTMSLERPNFIVLGTYYDMLHTASREVEDVKEYIAERNFQIKSKLLDFTECILRYGSSLVFPIDVTSPATDHTQSVIEAIRRKVSKCYIEKEIPLVWLFFQLSLDRQKHKKTIVEKSALVKIGSSYKMSSDDVESALLHFHDLSVVFYFPRFLNSIVFLNPQHFLDRLSQLCQLEKFDHKVLVNVMENNISMVDNVLKLLKKLLLITPTCSNKSEYFFPSILDRAPDTYLKTFDDENLTLDPLVLKWDVGPVPHGVFPAIIVCLIRDHQFQLLGGEGVGLSYRNAVRLIDDQEDVLLLDYFYWIEIHFNNSPLCYEIKEKIKLAIKEVASTLRYDTILSKPKEHFLCFKQHGEKEHPTERHLCTINESKEMITCSLDHSSTLINFQRQLPWLRATWFQKNKYIDDLDTAMTILKEGSFRFRKWVKLGLSLGLERSTLNSIQHDSTTKCLEECLVAWKAKTKMLKWVDLIEALVKIDEKNTAEYIRNQL